MFLFILTGCSSYQRNDAQSTTTVHQVTMPTKYKKALWLAYYELEKLTKGKNESDFTHNIKNYVAKMTDAGFNTLIVQVRPCADAFYKSSYFPVSKYFQGEQGSELIYDPFKIICDVASDSGISVEAWINPYRVSQNDSFELLSNDNIARTWQNTDKVKIVGKKIYFNPSYDEVKDLIINGVVEIVKSYNVSAIHFDDYFYPTTDKDIDKLSYEAYKQNGGELPLSAWRRENVSSLIKSVYSAIKKENPNVEFGISPAADIKNNYSKLYADVELWCNSDEYIDYICPQIYFGFKNEKMPFMQTVKKWVSLVDTSKVDLYIGIPLYKSGKADKYASVNEESAINEFKNATNIIPRQIIYLSKIEEVSGFCVYSFFSYFDSSAEEMDSIKSAMQSNNLP